MFVWRADSILVEIARHMPELRAQLEQITFGEIWELSDLTAQIESLYAAIASESIDYGVMEKSDRVQMVAADIGWSDVGSWSALPEVADVDGAGNVVSNCSAFVAIDSSGCIVSGNGGVVATVGLQNLIVVSTGDAVLVCPSERAQEVKQVVEQLQKRQLSRYL